MLHTCAEVICENFLVENFWELCNFYERYLRDSGLQISTNLSVLRFNCFRNSVCHISNFLTRAKHGGTC